MTATVESYFTLTGAKFFRMIYTILSLVLGLLATWQVFLLVRNYTVTAVPVTLTWIYICKSSQDLIWDKKAVRLCKISILLNRKCVLPFFINFCIFTWSSMQILVKVANALMVPDSWSSFLDVIYRTDFFLYTKGSMSCPTSLFSTWYIVKIFPYIIVCNPHT